MIGKTVSHYRIIDKLGQGGMGEVFLAEDISLQRKVALKFLPEEMLRDPVARKRFLREARSAAALDHPHICNIHEIDEVDDVPFIVMEYVEGETLRQKLARGPLPVREALQTALEVGEALDEAHAKGIIHRDLKPANIMLTRKGHAKVMDFGLAKQVDRIAAVRSDEETLTGLTREGTTLGTLAYMSPEQLCGKGADTRSDVFSFGVVLYEMLTGIHPFKKGAGMEIVSAILNNVPPPLTNCASEIPESLQQATSKMLAKVPEQRYQSMREVCSHLRHTLAEMQPGIPDASRAHVVRVLRPVWLTLAVLLLVFAVASLTWWVQQRYFKSPGAALAFQERDWILTTDFENLTGDEVFDKSLDTALRVSIEQSSYVNVFSRQRITEVLRRMKRSEVQRIDEALGREIAQREGVKALLLPSITGIAGTYLLSASLQDPRTGATVKAEMVRAQKKEKILDALDQLAQSIRGDLGESAGAISRQGKPLAKVTTSSLDALKQYSLGIENHRAGNFQEARAFYESALREDPDFTAATASLGMINFERFDTEKGKELLSKAVAQVGSLTDRERYSILAFYSRAVEKDLPNAIQHLKALVALYPDDSATHNNLGWFSYQMKRYDDAVAQYKEALRVDPTLMLSYNGLNSVYLYGLGEVSEAIELCRRQIAQDDRQYWAYDNLGWAYLGKGDLEQARVAFEKALELNPKSTQGLFRLAHTYRLQKEYAKALQALRRIPEADPSQSIQYDLGVIYQLMNDAEQARKHFELKRLEVEKDIRATPKDVANHIVLAIVRARLGQVVELRLPDRGGSPENPNEYFLLANLYGVQGQVDKAIEQLEQAIQKGWRNYIFMKIHPDHQSLYNEPRFQALLKRCIKG